MKPFILVLTQCARLTGLDFPSAWNWVLFLQHWDKHLTQPFYVLAGQEGVWELRFKPNYGLEWRIGDSILRGR